MPENVQYILEIGREGKIMRKGTGYLTSYVWRVVYLKRTGTDVDYLSNDQTIQTRQQSLSVPRLNDWNDIC